MKSKFNIGDKVIIESACIIIDNPICKVIEILDSQSYMIIDIEGCKWIVAENEMEYIERMKNKYQINDKVILDREVVEVVGIHLTKSNECMYKIKYDCIHETFKENVLEFELKLYTEEPKEKVCGPSLDCYGEYNKLSEENEDLRELLEIVKATIQMISELI